MHEWKKKKLSNLIDVFRVAHCEDVLTCNVQSIQRMTEVLSKLESSF